SLARICGFNEMFFYRCCAFFNTIVQVADQKSPDNLAVNQHKSHIIDYVTALIRGWESDPERFTVKFALLVDGAAVTAVREEILTAAVHAQKISEQPLYR
ncbi:MAG: hypothetical protein ACRCSF_01960, partial [Mycobacteriaceae bacterium]